MSGPQQDGRGVGVAEREYLALRILQWAVHGDKGCSSDAIANASLGLRLGQSRHDYPYDTGDLGRCLRLIHQIPETREGLRVLAGVPGHFVWWELEQIWDALTAQAVQDGVLTHRSTFGNGPTKTLTMLRAAILRGREAEKTPTN